MKPMSVPEKIESVHAPRPQGHYSQAVLAGNLLFISGQLPLDPLGRLMKGTISDEVVQTLKNVQAVLENAGGHLNQLVQCTIYIADIADWHAVDQAYGAFLRDSPVFPARAIIPVKELHYGARVEIQAIAVLYGEA